VDEQERLARIRLVAKQFDELQGLRHALIGGAFAFAMGGSLIANGWTADDTSLVVSIIVVFTIVVPGMLWLDAYYASTFGRVAPPSGTERWFVPAVVVVLVSLVVFGPSGGGFFLFLGTRSLWIAIRDWPLRGHHFVSAAAGVVAASVQWTERGQQAPDSAMAAGFLLFGVASVVTGCADHRLLASVATHEPEPATTDQTRA
jgi:hypothetical protein